MADRADDLRFKVATSSRILGMQGLVRESTGHVSARIPGKDEMWIRCRGGRVVITSGKYAGRTGNIESNVYQRTADYPDERANGNHVMLDTGVLVTVRWDLVNGSHPCC